MIKITLLLLSIFTLQLSIAQQNKNDYRQRISLIQNNINQYFYDPKTGLYIETTDSAKNEHPHSYLWPLCALIQATNEADALAKANTMQPVVKAIDQYYSPRPPAPGYQAYVAKEKKDTRFYDDNQWVAIAYLDAYNRTHQPFYLDKSKEIERFMMTGFDLLSGGGLYWEEDHKTSKNTCSNGPGILILLQLYNITQQKPYLDTALLLYNWVNKHLQSPEGLYYDNIKIPSLEIGKALYTYNTGTMLQAAVLLYKITQNKEYLTEAERIAKAAKEQFYKNGKLPDNYWINAVLVRGFIEFYKVDKNKPQLQFLMDDAERIWKEERDENNLLGKKKAKTLIDQAAMMETYARLAEL
ncbi:MAG: glycoside hydrolase family 76 protein [Bacteroidota bacterium]|nr:glycoside hydrolase family 76 protein [Bacteroidota bacterium]